MTISVHESLGYRTHARTGNDSEQEVGLSTRTSLVPDESSTTSRAMWQNQGESRLGGPPGQGRTHREGAALGNISHEVKGLSPANFGASSPILSHNGLGFLISYGS